MDSCPMCHEVGECGYHKRLREGMKRMEFEFNGSWEPSVDSPGITDFTVRAKSQCACCIDKDCVNKDCPCHVSEVSDTDVK